MPLTGYANPSVAHHLTFVLFASVRVVQALFDWLLFFTCMFYTVVVVVNPDRLIKLMSLRTSPLCHNT
jgi:hypothetical protein